MMSMWIYLQAGLDLIFGIGIALLLIERRKHAAILASQGDILSLAETLGELLVEVEQVRHARPPSAEITQPVMPSPAVPMTDLARSVPAPSGMEFSTRPRNGISVDPVLSLAEQGLPADEIARRLGRPIGEVALVLQLKGSRPALVT